MDEQIFLLVNELFGSTLIYYFTMSKQMNIFEIT